MKVFLFLILTAVMFSPTIAFAEELRVVTSQEVYEYGEFLSFTVTVPQVTEDFATFRIIDETGMGSSTITMAITGENTVLTAPNPFLSNQFRTGEYTIEIEYDGDITTTQFQLIDSGKVVIPFWIKDVAGLWIEQVINDAGFFKNLVDNEVVMIDQTLNDNTSILIPSWYKDNAEWWRNGYISDDEFAKGLQYLITINAITIEG